MNYKRFLKNKPQQGCIGPCTSNMIRSGMCTCDNPYNNSKKSKSPFFQYQYWIYFMIAICLLSFFFHIGFVLGIGLAIAIFIYFKYFKK